MPKPSGHDRVIPNAADGEEPDVASTTRAARPGGTPANSPAFQRRVALPPTPKSRRDDCPFTLNQGLSSDWYHGTLVPMTDQTYPVERVQTGVRIEKRLLKVLKAFAEYHDLTLGDLLEGIVLHAFDGKSPFSPDSLNRIKELKKFYALDLDSTASHRLKETKPERKRKRTS